MPTGSNKSFKDISGLKRISGTNSRPGLGEDQKGLTQDSVKSTIIYAIANNYKIDMYYEDDEGGGTVLRGYRSVSPVAIGTHVTTGNIVFRAYLLEGVSKSERTPKWRLFRVDRVKSIKVYFSPAKAKWDVLYRPNDKHIGTMFEQAKRNKQSVKRRVDRKNT